ncbi:MAG TPA: hypothetical protein VJW76_04910 [Verrucomicrobiae bacterium]|nr:hypothetical protein [Verrucomicrobiae bacterium]
MKTILRLSAIIIVVAAVVAWFVGGTNRGWTKTSVPVMKKEPVTEIEYQEFEARFSPGVDFLGAALLGAGVLAGVSFLFRNKPTPT